MNCMKCGRETAADNAYCYVCLAEMEKFPVRPGTVILLPTQEPPLPKKTVRKKKPALSPDEQIPLLKKKVWFLRLIALVLTLLLTAISVVAIQAVTELDWQRLLGQNYSTMDDSHTNPQTGR